MPYTDIFKKKDIILDTFTKNDGSPVTSFSQGDRLSDKLFFNVTNDGSILDLTDAVNVRMDFEKPDKHLVFQYCQMEDKANGTASIILNSQTVAVPGTVQAEVTVEYPTGKKLVTRRFTFHVDAAIAGDSSIESSDFAPMLEKAIEAGEKLEGVDIDGIIAAGAKADAALPKTGGTMTGDLVISGANKVIAVKNGTSQLNQAIDNNGMFYWYNPTGAKTPLRYDIATDSLSILATNTNVYKKTELYPDWLTATGVTRTIANGTDLNTVVKSGIYAGTGLVNAPNTGYFYLEVIQHSDTKYTLQRATSLTGGTDKATWVRRLENSVWGAWERLIDSKGGTLTGELFIDRKGTGKYYRWYDGATQEIALGVAANGIFELYDAKNGSTALSYDPVAKQVNISAAANVVKKAGDTMTGDLSLEIGAGASRKIAFRKTGGTLLSEIFSNEQVFTLRHNDGTSVNDVLKYSYDTKRFDVLTPNTNLVTKTKDGRATLTLTADGENPTTSAVPISERRGNTVTVSGSLRRKSGAVGDVVTTLPADMRPVSTQRMTLLATDGTKVFVTISSVSGNIAFDAIDKEVYLQCTYVVD